MKRLAYAAAALLLLVVALLLAAPAFIDTPAVRAEIQRRLSQALNGQVEWESLEIALFPAPHGELRKVRIEIPGRLSAAADELNVYLRFWPLLRGQPEVSSVELKKPSVRILTADGGESEAPRDAVALYRSAMEPAVRALQDFAPDMALKVEAATIELGAPLELRGLNAVLKTGNKGVDLELATAANLWKRLTLEARIEYADLSARAALALDALTLDKDLPPAALHAKLRTDGKSALECDFDGSLGSLVPSAKGKLRLPAGQPPELAAEIDRADVAQALAVARVRVGGLDTIESAHGRVSARADVSLGPSWSLHVNITKSDAAVQLAQLPWKLSAQAGRVTVTQERVDIAGVKGSLGDSTFENVAGQVVLGKTAHLSAGSGAATISLEQWFPWLQAKLPLEELSSVSGRVEVKLNRLALRFDRPAEVDFDAAARPRKVTVALKALPSAISIAGGEIHADRRQLRIAGLEGALDRSTFSGVAAHIDLKTKRLSSASGRVALDLAQWFPWLQAKKLPLEEISSLSGSLDVALERLALRFDDPAAADFDAVVAPRKVSAALKALPAPVRADGGTVRAGPMNLMLKDVAIATLDASMLVSGTIGIRKPRIELALSEGVSGEKLVRWALELAGVPARFEPRTPLRFAAQRIAWAPKAALEADARIEFEGGPALALALAWRPELLELRRVAIKDARSDAVLAATVAGELIQASFSGTLDGRSIPAMLRQPLPANSGTAQGELRLTIDRKQPERTEGEGRLRIEALDLTWLAGRKALIERAELIAERTGARITDARFGWEDQFFELRGTGRRTDQGPVIEARIESDGVMLERLLPPADPGAPKKKSAAIWPLPLSGRVEVRTGFIQYKDYRIEPFDGILSLEPQKARLEVKEARMCGVSFPMELEAHHDEQASAAAHIRMQNEPLERTVRCLTGGNIELTGNADLKAELRVQGRRPHLVRGLTGTLETEVRQGHVKKFALLGNILSFRSIAALGEMKDDGFPYRKMTARGRFENGAFLVEESFFDSDAVRLAAHGRVDLLGANSQLTVLVGLLTRVDRIAGAIPIVGDVFGGSMTALPIGVHGDIRDPLIVPLGPRAVSDQLLGIFERTLKLPGKLVVPAQEAKP